MSTLSRQARSAERGRFNMLHIILVGSLVVTALWAVALTIGALWVIGSAYMWLVTL